MISLLLLLPIFPSIIQGTSLSRVSPAELGNNNAYIVGGWNAPQGAVPCQASLRNQHTNEHLCGAIIINKRNFLSAAHCVYNMNKYDMIIWAGTNKLNDRRTSSYYPEELIPHENYHSVTKENDIAAIRVTRDIVMTVRSRPIAINPKIVGARVVMQMSGWGDTSYPTSVVPNDLQWANVTSIPLDDCRDAHKNGPGVITLDHICSMTTKNMGACIGDSGGPLVVDNMLVGMVSWGEGCAQGYPDVHMRILKFKKWIEDHTKI